LENLAHDEGAVTTNTFKTQPRQKRPWSATDFTIFKKKERKEYGEHHQLFLELYLDGDAFRCTSV